MDWDIAAIQEDIKKMNFNIEYKNVLHLSEKTGGYCNNPEYAMETDIDSPCIIVKLNANYELFIDGNHRLYKARKLNIETIPCYVLPLEYHIKFIIDYDPAIYEKISAERIE